MAIDRFEPLFTKIMRDLPCFRLSRARRRRGYLVAELTKALDNQGQDRKVTLKLTIPAKPDRFAPRVAHSGVARVVALSGGFTRNERASS